MLEGIATAAHGVAVCSRLATRPALVPDRFEKGSRRVSGHLIVCRRRCEMEIEVWKGARGTVDPLSTLTLAILEHRLKALLKDLRPVGHFGTGRTREM